LFQKLSDFLREVLRTFMIYANEVIKKINDVIDYVIVLLQLFLSEVLAGVADQIRNFLREFGLAHFSVAFGGLTFEVTLPDEVETENCQCILWVRTRGDLWQSDVDFTTFLIEFDEPIENLKYYMIVQGSLEFGEEKIANVTIDPFMFLLPHLAEVHASDLGAESNGWVLDLYMPELDVYKNAVHTLSDVIGFLPTIPIPALGVEVGVDLGVAVKYHAPREDHLVINEFEMNPASGPNWVELYNPVWRPSYQLREMSLEGYELRSSNGTLLADLDGLSIDWAGRSGGAYLVVELQRPLINPEGWTPSEAGDRVILYDSEHRIVDITPMKVDEETYASIFEGMKKDHWHRGLTYQRKYDGSPEWILEEATRGRTNPRVPSVDLKRVVIGTLRESFAEAFLELELSPSLEFVGELIKTLIQKFIDKSLAILEEAVVELVFYVDVAVSAIASKGAAGGGFRLSLVVEREAIFGLLNWLRDIVEEFVHNLYDPANPSPYSSMPNNLLTHLGIRFEVYFTMGFPKMLRKLGEKKDSDNFPKKMDVAISIQLNVPALVRFTGINWGRWKIDFGIYVQNFPASSLGKLYALSKDSITDLWLVKGQIYEVCDPCR
ncbi:MAG: hypothetical protein ACE5KV_07505, partial [Thermoplasmata archaeon]